MRNFQNESEAISLLKQFLRMQDSAYTSLRSQYPDENIDLYHDRLKDLFANLNVLMYYEISPSKLDAVLKLFKPRPDFALFDEKELELNSFGKIIDILSILLYKQGQINSLRSNVPMNSQGQPLPWLTYPAIEFLSQFDYADSDIFEFGAGNSTLYWASKARRVTSVETDLNWYGELSKRIPSNVELLYTEEVEHFVAALARSPSQYSMIVIDSIKYRYDATVSAIEHIAPGGLIVLDNSDWYPNSCQLLRDMGFVQVDFHGLGAVNAYAWTTSVFFKESIKFQRLERCLRPIGGQEITLEDDSPRMCK